MRKISTCFLVLLPLSLAFAQDQNIESKDSTQVLNEVVVHAYLTDRPLSEVPAAIGVVNTPDFERFNNTSILPAVNAIPGVRMEERSPGSYRFSIRGSLLRSPFGVRNVKVYWNGLPLTDGGGNTYLNLLDFNAVSSAEVIKGPGGSLYGAGTGGVVLFNSNIGQPSLKFSTVFGSFGLQRYQISGQTGTDKVKVSLNYAHQEADGYREQTKMKKDAINADVSIRTGSKGTLSTSLFYTDLYYQTPGGLTKAQYDANPKQARPATPTLPGAVDAKAAVTNKTGYLGVSYEYSWNDNWITRTGVYGSLTSFENPTIRNFESRDETNVGGRTETQYSFGGQHIKGKLTFGGEYQYFTSPLRVYSNSGGVAGAIQSDDDLTSNQFLAFAQAEIDLPLDFYLTAGASGNFLKYNFIAKIPDYVEQRRRFDPVISPRVALLKKLSPTISAYASVSRGFSPPSLAEVRPSTGQYNNSLDPERGMSYELGLRGGFFKQQLQFDVTGYDFRLDETIVIQRDNEGVEFFVNAGKTSQRGLEAKLSWTPKLPPGVVSAFKIWGSYTYNHYRFKQYVQDGNNFSGNRLTGVAPTIAVFGADVSIYKFYLNVTTNYTDAIALNDANTEYASEYFLLGSRLGFKTNITRNLPIDIFGGLDNALDKRYSLGNDLNAAPITAGRYYNAAAPRNFYVGLTLNPFFAKK